MGVNLDRLCLDRSHYYIKRSSIVEKITFNNRTLYAKFERIDEPLTNTLLSQHLNRQYVIAASLLKDGKTDNIVLEYRGENPSQFYHTSKHLLSTLGIKTFHYYRGKKNTYLQLFISVDKLDLNKADDMVHKISDALESKITKKWKCFPDKSLPESYNIVTLPYQEFTQ
jgi:hypothetical protein